MCKKVIKTLIYLYFIFNSLLLKAQGEANYWYFGLYAGVHFNNGVQPNYLTDSAMHSFEGCSTISNANGQLLFYTNGVTVYNRNHQIMLNGDGLLGDENCTQSATIVKKPNSQNIYYIFTLDDNIGVNGFRYSVVDMSLDNGLGAITSEKNILIASEIAEKCSVVNHANNTDIWVVVHGYYNNTFHSYLLTPTGLSTTPVNSSIGFYLPMNAIDYLNGAVGYMKISPNGKKLALCHTFDKAFEVFDFDNNTGLLSNNIVLDYYQSGQMYGVEFSPNSQLVYVSCENIINQYNLMASNVPASKFVFNFDHQEAPMQLGPDKKIYIGGSDLSVINSPNNIGYSLNFTPYSVDLGPGAGTLGLPTFNSSYFYDLGVQFSNSCVGNSVSFGFGSSQNVISASWNFGDGMTSNLINPTHIYNLPGNYTVTATVNYASGTETNSKTITIYPKPNLLHNSITLKQCDDDNDGMTSFNLKEVENMLVSNPSDFVFTYHFNYNEALISQNPINNPMVYTNSTPNSDVVYVRIDNGQGCCKVATIYLNISTTNIPSSFHKIIKGCDDEVSGSNLDGIGVFDLTSSYNDIQALYPVGQLIDITFYASIQDALAEQNPINNISNYINSVPFSENIIVRVDSQINNECLGIGHHITLQTESIPLVNDITLYNCDDNNDGIAEFNTANIEQQILNGISNVSVTYTDSNGNVLPSPLPNPFFTSTQDVKVRVTNLTPLACYDEAFIHFNVDGLPNVNPLPSTLTTICDNENNPLNQDGIAPFDTTNFENTLIGSQTGLIIKYYDQNGQLLSSPLPNPFNSPTQNITVEVYNSINSQCFSTSTIPLVVKPLPSVYQSDIELVCSNNPNFIKTIDAGLVNSSDINSYNYQWFYNGNILPSATNYNLTVNQEGIYTVEVSNSGGCPITRTVTVSASNVATIEDIQITDLSNNNSIVIAVSGPGNYEFSLDGENYQTSNVFSNLDSGIYNVYITDTNGCGEIIKQVSLLGIPNYFTPNGDGFNDTWNIKGLFENKGSNFTQIFIYDRFGKLLKQISAENIGWDGTYNGQNMPSEDYWYKIILNDGRIFKGHFSLKR